MKYTQMLVKEKVESAFAEFSLVTNPAGASSAGHFRKIFSCGTGMEIT